MVGNKMERQPLRNTRSTVVTQHMVQPHFPSAPNILTPEVGQMTVVAVSEAEAHAAAESLLDLIDEHEGTHSCQVAEKLICSAASSWYGFNLSSLYRFDATNFNRAITLIAYVGRRSSAFRDWLMATHGIRVRRIIEKNREGFERDARELLRK